MHALRGSSVKIWENGRIVHWVWKEAWVDPRRAEYTFERRDTFNSRHLLIGCDALTRIYKIDEDLVLEEGVPTCIACMAATL